MLQEKTTCISKIYFHKQKYITITIILNFSVQPQVLCFKFIDEEGFSTFSVHG